MRKTQLKLQPQQLSAKGGGGVALIRKSQ